jgi:hypothetical protein
VKAKNKANGMVLFMLVCGSGFFAFAQGFRHFLGHLGGEHVGIMAHFHSPVPILPGDKRIPSAMTGSGTGYWMRSTKTGSRQ